MARCLYNGQNLPAPPAEWNETTHPYAFVTLFGEYAYFKVFDKLGYLELLDTGYYRYTLGSLTTDDDPQYIICSSWKTAIDGGTEWEAVNTDSSSVGHAANNGLLWANETICYEDGTVAIESSNLVYVEETTENSYSMLQIGISIGMAIKGRSAASIEGNTYILVDENGNSYAAVEVDELTLFTATAADVLRGKVAASNEGVIVGTYEPNLQDKTVTPTTSQQIITHDEGYDGLGEVIVEPTEVVLSDEDTRRNVLSRSLSSFNFPDGVTAIGSGAFFGCVDLNFAAIPESITEIGDYAFFNCAALALSELPPDLLTLGIGAFYACTGLTLTALPETITHIGDYAFDGCTGLSLTVLPENLATICNYAFCGCENLALVALPSAVTIVGDYAFSECAKIAIATLPDGLKSIGVGAFNECPGLTISALPATVKTIGNYAFAACTGLTAITFNGTPTSIAANAFDGCANLATINVPWAEGAVANAPWGATNATINYGYTGG